MTKADERIAQLERAWREQQASRSEPKASEGHRAGEGEVFAPLAELYRRAGRLAEAAKVVRQGLAHSPRSLEGRAVLLLVLADAGQAGEARRLLESWAGAALETGFAQRAEGERRPAGAVAPAPVSDLEFERAFDAAEPDLEQMITPDTVAEEAALFADGAEALRSPLESGGAFATRTMAELLERQGDRRGAARIRAALADTEAPDAPEPARPHALAIAALERWLENVRRLQP